MERGSRGDETTTGKVKSKKGSKMCANTLRRIVSSSVFGVKIRLAKRSPQHASTATQINELQCLVLNLTLMVSHVTTQVQISCETPTGRGTGEGERRSVRHQVSVRLLNCLNAVYGLTNETTKQHQVQFHPLAVAV